MAGSTSSPRTDQGQLDRASPSPGEVTSSAPARLCADRHPRREVGSLVPSVPREPSSWPIRSYVGASALDRSVVELGHQLAAEGVDERLLVGVDQGRAARRTSRRRCHRRRRPAPSSASTCVTVGAGQRDDRDGVVRQPAGVQGRGRRRGEVVAVVDALRASAPLLGGRGRCGRLSSRPRSVNGPAAEDDADREREEDGDERRRCGGGRRSRDASLQRVELSVDQAVRESRPLLADRSHGDRGGEGDQPGQHDQEQVPRTDPAGVERAGRRSASTSRGPTFSRVR